MKSYNSITEVFSLGLACFSSVALRHLEQYVPGQFDPLLGFGGAGVVHLLPYL